MTRDTLIRWVCGAAFLLGLACTAGAQTTVYNNFGPNHDGWDYTYNLGWTVAEVNVPSQYGVEQAMSFTSTASGEVSDIWVAFFYVPSSPLPDTVTIKLARNPSGNPPDTTQVMEQWVITSFESWVQWTPPIHLAGSGSSQLQEGKNYWLWAMGEETTWCGWCLNINPALTCPHTLRREGENWLPIANETASAFRVDVISVTPVTVTLTPTGMPILIPASGGRFRFETTMTNNQASPITTQLWIKTQLPDGTWHGPVLGPLSVTLPAQQTVTRERSQTVPASAPSGSYIYRGWVGTYPTAPLDSSSFTFTKLATGNGGQATGDWTITGEEFNETEMPITTSESSLMTSVSPNPFNLSAALSFKLQAASQVSLRVYDTTGRLVTTLVDSRQEVGTHEFTFDGSGLPSGVYLYRLQTGEWTASGKMVLLK